MESPPSKHEMRALVLRRFLRVMALSISAGCLLIGPSIIAHGRASEILVAGVLVVLLVGIDLAPASYPVRAGALLAVLGAGATLSTLTEGLGLGPVLLGFALPFLGVLFLGPGVAVACFAWWTATVAAVGLLELSRVYVAPSDPTQLRMAAEYWPLLVQAQLFAGAPVVYSAYLLVSRLDSALEAERRAHESLVRAGDDLAAANTRLQAANTTLEARSAELERRNQEVEAFVYIVSHDLRAPLVNLQGFTHELALGCRALGTAIENVPMADTDRATVHRILDQDIQGSMPFISASATKFQRLIDALLALSRTGRQELRVEDVDVASVVASTLDSLRISVDEKRATVTVGALPRAMADVTALGQIFSNLLTNALKYLDPGRPGAIAVGGEVRGDQSRYWVRDNGVGIAERGKSRLFQVFQRMRPDLAPGEGMGLATVKRLVERLDGEISVETEEGVGTTVAFTLPACRPKEHRE